ncbi:hypothetical protein [Puia sp.]|uniref:hypothetical protein n=1 Tax=Puia sp. TaxID=2045100 RepID=UPI002F3F91E4
MNSGSYLRTVFVFISGITTFTGLAGGAGFFTSGLDVKGGGVGRAVATALPRGGAGVAGFAAAWACCAFVTGAVTFEIGVVVAWLFAAGLEVLDTADFFVGKGGDFLADADGATFLAAGLAILFTGAFFAALLPPDEWTDFDAVFLAGATFLTFTVFLPAGFASFFLVAIQLGFFSDEHF